MPTPLVQDAMHRKSRYRKMIWGGEPLLYSTNIIFGAKNTERTMDGPELITRRGAQIPRKYLYDIASKLDAIREWDGDPYYLQYTSFLLPPSSLQSPRKLVLLILNQRAPLESTNSLEEIRINLTT